MVTIYETEAILLWKEVTGCCSGKTETLRNTASRRQKQEYRNACASAKFNTKVIG